MARDRDDRSEWNLDKISARKKKKKKKIPRVILPIVGINVRKSALC